MASRVASARERLTRGSPALDAAASTLLDRAVDRIPLSGRGRARVVRVSQTVACLAREGQVSAEHIAEALSYRVPRELAGAA